MAGDWMKIDLELPDKPEVHAIASTLNIDPDAVVGKLIRIWQWFDKHTIDGNAHGVTFALPDRISGVTGFGEAMMFAGWLEQRDKTLVMPSFEKHTSASAKSRALTANRVAKNKAKNNADGNANTVTITVSDSLPREEKRREDKTSSSTVVACDSEEDSGNGIYTPAFLTFWELYPNRVNKGAAFKAFKKIRATEYKAIREGLERKKQSQAWIKDNGQFIPHAATWLNARGWEDEDANPKAAAAFDVNEWARSKCA